MARASWADEQVRRGTLADIEERIAAAPVSGTVLILVGRALEAADFRESALYDPGYVRRFRANGA